MIVLLDANADESRATTPAGGATTPASAAAAVMPWVSALAPLATSLIDALSGKSASSSASSDKLTAMMAAMQKPNTTGPAANLPTTPPAPVAAPMSATAPIVMCPDGQRPNPTFMSIPASQRLEAAAAGIQACLDKLPTVVPPAAKKKKAPKLPAGVPYQTFAIAPPPAGTVNPSLALNRQMHGYGLGSLELLGPGIEMLGPGLELLGDDTTGALGFVRAHSKAFIFAGSVIAALGIGLAAYRSSKGGHMAGSHRRRRALRD